MKTKFTLLTLLALLGTGSFINAQKLESFVLQTPEKYLPGVKKIAILNFENFNKDASYNTFGGSAFVDYLSSALLDESRGIYVVASTGLFSADKPGKTFVKNSSINTFQIIEREQLNTVLKEKNLGSNVTLNDNQAADIGKVLGIDILITGTLKHNFNSNRTYTEYKDGSRSYSTENKCETEVNVKIISVATAQVIATKTFMTSSKDYKGGSEEGKVMTFEQLAPMNLKLLAFKTACYISPSYEYCKTEFGKIKVEEFKEKAKQVNTYLDNGDLKSAYALYKAIYDADNYNAVAAYNIAQLYYITGDYVECAKWDEIAFQIDSKAFGKVYEVAKQWAEKIKILNEMGITIEKYDFSTNSDVLAEKAHTAGKKADRFEAYENPDKSSPVLSKVPGDTDFTIVKKEGEFIRVKLLGGKEGYLHKTSID